MNNIFLVKNFFGYEPLLPVPQNLPTGITTIYLTDMIDVAEKAHNLGWDIAIVEDSFLNITDKFERRMLIAKINCYPQLFIPELLQYDLVFISDSNIISLWDEYKTFVQNCDKTKAMFLTSGYYWGDIDNIQRECESSLQTERWSYNHDNIKKRTEYYIDELKSRNIDANKLSVVSAKYFGWNLKNEYYPILADTFYKEYMIHLQGNIILTYMSGIFKDNIYNYHTNNYSGGLVSEHNYNR